LNADAEGQAVDAFLGLIADKGVAGTSLRDVAQASGRGFAEFYAVFPDKISLVAAFLARVDREVMAGGAPFAGGSPVNDPSTDPDETPRDRLFDTMMRRYDALKPHRAALKALRRAVTTDPFFAMALAPHVRRSMACMLEEAGLPSDGLAGAVRQTGLLVLHGLVLSTFEGDESGDLSKTMAALDRRLKDAEKLAQGFEKYGKLPSRRSPAGPTDARGA
jgi:AcrR family transcriptional regulator